ncbi:plasmid maintenance protein CcdB [Noviherbaspirillum sedimenti]|uniref:Toxin CcdB n=1 Tax=Noviherbaspirillum sedimenti TaxID=2320865 RepID=A0A3A3G2G0_9BURK|nr:plasmid maintenance protein CcdB [Noviherbaspirillum sedimenti]
MHSDFISGLATRIVSPLRAMDAFPSVRPPADLCPVIEVDGKDYFLDTPQLDAIPANELKDHVRSAQGNQFQIMTALDKVFGGY